MLRPTGRSQMCTATRSAVQLTTSFLLAITLGDAAAADLSLGVTPSQAELSKFVSPLPDGRGLPQGQGSAAKGAIIYGERCSACHGANLEGGIGDRLIGGRESLVNSDPLKAPIKTVESYWPYATTLFDYVKRAMPFDAPGSLSNDEVYSVCAYILSEAKIITSETVVSDANLARIQMPNREGFVSDHRPEAFPPAASVPHQFKTLSAVVTR